LRRSRWSTNYAAVGAVAFLGKPFEIERVNAIIAAHLALGDQGAHDERRAAGIFTSLNVYPLLALPLSR